MFQLQLQPNHTHVLNHTLELLFPSPSFSSTLEKNKIIDIIQMPSPNLKRKYDSITTDTPRKLILKQKLRQKNKLIHNKISHV